ncbi:MAG: cold shock domain-containing protein [Bdellovibrionaceae bacterium]|nr:cold shock domain-containing protein [Pseudobdellovibrionaceae bacterium]
MARSKTISQAWQLGTVHWFDEKSGEGMIKSDDGQSYYVHYSAIDSEKKWKSLKDNKKVKFQLIDDVTFAQVSRVKEV